MEFGLSRALDQQLAPQLVARRAAESGGRVCMIDVSQGVTTTYAELHDQAVRWAASLRAAGIHAEATVVTMLHSGVTPVAVWLGLGWLRAITIPVNEEYGGQLLADVVNDALGELIIVSEQFYAQVVGIVDVCPTVRRIVVVKDGGSSFELGDVRGNVTVTDDFLCESATAADLEGPTAHDTACVLYTSGTTGRSKGVVIPWQHCYEAGIWAMPFEYMGEGDVAYMPFPAHHMSFLGPIYGMFLLNGAVVTRRRFSVSTYWDDVKTHSCTYGPLLGSMAALLSSQAETPADVDNPMRYVTMVPVVDDLDAYEKRFCVQVGTLFGMTELTAPIRSDGWRVRIVDGVASCGRARPGVQARIVDEHDWPVPAGTVGELVLRYDDPWTMTTGYWKNPTATAGAWRNGWFHTGDAMIQNAEGDFFHRDRIRDVIRRRGENIASAAVEVIVAQHSEIAEVAAIGVPSPLGEQDVKIVVVLSEGSTLSAADLDLYLAERMPRFMRPRYIEMVSEMPKTATLKIRKAELRTAGVTPGTWDRDRLVSP
jgi:crotonobetaine/carnitine-CoA ligase